MPLPAPVDDAVKVHLSCAIIKADRPCDRNALLVEPYEISKRSVLSIEFGSFALWLA